MKTLVYAQGLILYQILFRAQSLTVKDAIFLFRACSRAPHSNNTNPPSIQTTQNGTTSNPPSQFVEVNTPNSPSSTPSMNKPTQEPDSNCKSRINFLRSKFEIPLIEERKDLHTCANRQSEYDKQVGAHASFKRCGSLGSQGQGGGSSCASVIDAFYHERWSCTTKTALFKSPFKELDIGSSRQCRSECMDDSQCLSYGFDDDFTPPCHFYDEGSVTHANEINGLYYLGGDTDIAPGSLDTFQSNSFVDIDGSSAVPSNGVITSFKWFGSNTNGVDFHVFRSSADDTFEVIGTIHAASTVINTENSIDVSPITVQKGDFLGFTWKGAPAFGFDDNSRLGQTLYTDENSGGPSFVGQTWNFENGPLGRRYHFAASFIPDDAFTPLEPRNYCAAGLCQGHCGPVMSSTTRTFSWGEYENFYTLNWRPGATLPSGGDSCPSGIAAVRCWNDENTGILWAYGVGGEDCHSTCSLAGATSAEFKCDADSPITGGMDQVSQIMSNFANPYDENDSDQYSCTSGICWNGESNKQIMLHEYNSNCYIPTNLEQYACTSRFGNANCFGQRFNQACPCISGCSWAAGPSCSE